METRIIPTSAQHLPIYKEYPFPYLALRGCLEDGVTASAPRLQLRNTDPDRQAACHSPLSGRGSTYTHTHLTPRPSRLPTSDIHELSHSSQGTFAYVR